VLPGSEAIVTQSKKIIGKPRKPGFHKINWFTQEVHHLEVERLRDWIVSLERCDLDLRIYWNISNSILFYRKFGKAKIDKQLDGLFTKVKSHIENNFNLNCINKDSIETSDSNCQQGSHDDIIGLFQNETSQLGIKMVRIDLISITDEN